MPSPTNKDKKDTNAPFASTDKDHEEVKKDEVLAAEKSKKKKEKKEKKDKSKKKDKTTEDKVVIVNYVDDDEEEEVDAAQKLPGGVCMEAPDPSSYNTNNHEYPVEESEEDNSWPLIHLLFFWADSVLWRGWKLNWRNEAMVQNDLLLLPRNEEAIKCYQTFKPNWEAELKRFKEIKKTQPDASPSMFSTLAKSYKSSLIIGAFGRLIADGCSFAGPFMLRELINWLTDVGVDPNSRDEFEGYVWAVAIAINQFLMSYCNNTCLFYTSKAFCQMRSSAALAIFDKAGLLEADNGLEGIAVQLHTTDGTKFLEMAFFFHQIWSSPFLIIGLSLRFTTLSDGLA